MASEYFRLDGKKAVPCTRMEWAESGDCAHRVAKDEIEGCMVSTVFLGLNHRFGDGSPLIFETMIFGGKLDQECWRYSTWDEAEAGHKHALQQVIEAEDQSG